MLARDKWGGTDVRFRNLSPFLPTLALLSATVAVDAQNGLALAGRWEGTLIPAVQRGSRDLSSRANRPRLPTVVIIETASDGTHSGTWASTSQNGVTEISKITIDGENVLIDVRNWRGSFEGTLSADGSTLDGRWTQAGLISPFVLKKVAAK
jgi:hypothetical protein